MEVPGQGERRERLERSETVERLERLERDPFLVSIRDHYSARVEKGNKKNSPQERLCLLTCLLMDDPGMTPGLSLSLPSLLTH